MKLLAMCLAMIVWNGAMAADLKPCEVLTEADVRAVFGAEWKRVGMMLSESEVCAYQSSPTNVVTLLLTHDGSGADYILAGRKKMAGNKAQSATGSGAGACRVSTPTANAIVFGKGEWVGQIEVTPAATKDLSVLDRLTKTAYDRLP